MVHAKQDIVICDVHEKKKPLLLLQSSSALKARHSESFYRSVQR